MQAAEDTPRNLSPPMAGGLPKPVMYYGSLDADFDRPDGSIKAVGTSFSTHPESAEQSLYGPTLSRRRFAVKAGNWF